MTEESRRVRDREGPADAAQLVSNTEEGATPRNPSGLHRLQAAREETLPQTEEMQPRCPTVDF